MQAIVSVSCLQINGIVHIRRGSVDIDPVVSFACIDVCRSSVRIGIGFTGSLNGNRIIAVSGINIQMPGTDHRIDAHLIFSGPGNDI